MRLCAQLLHNLYQNKLIQFDWSTCKWNWDPVRINKLSTTDSALEFWESLLAGRSTTDMRKTVFAAAAISTGGAFSLKLLAYVVSNLSIAWCLTNKRLLDRQNNP